VGVKRVLGCTVKGYGEGYGGDTVVYRVDGSGYRMYFLTRLCIKPGLGVEGWGQRSTMNVLNPNMTSLKPYEEHKIV
jgi:hypothetical protein